jgi:phospholipase C
MRKLKTTLLSTAAVIAVAATVTSNRPVAAQSFATELNQIINLVDQLAADFKIPEPIKTPAPVNANATKTATPIKHLVVIFQENRSFDHYFGTYPTALNPPGEPVFTAARGTPTLNNYQPLATSELFNFNPNLALANGAGATNPFRLDRTQANTNDQSHNYTNEQKAFDNGAGDLFPLDVGSAGTETGTTSGVNIGAGLGAAAFNTKGQTMGYFDGNTVTAFWNYAQNYAMSDNSWSDTYGPSTPGLLNMFAGNTNGIVPTVTGTGAASGNALPDGTGNTTNGFTLIGDIDPTMDVCSPASPLAHALGSTSNGTTVTSTANNIGAMLSAAKVPWGSFVGGFNLSTVNPANGAVPATTGCGGITINPATGLPVFTAGNPGRVSVSADIVGINSPAGADPDAPLVPIPDYTQHHIWFQYFQSTANPNHTRPASTAEIGHDGAANHAYDFNDLKTAIQAGNNPAVAFIKMPAFQDSHPGNSDPLDEQTGIVNLINFLQESPDWNSTAVIIAYDDSDGWYDHAFIQPTTRASFSSADALNVLPIAATGNTPAVPGQCGRQASGATEPVGVNGLPVAGRCGPGMRQPFLVISPWAKKNFIDHTFITQASIPQFIEDNWLDGQRLNGGSYDNQTGSIMTMFNFNQFFGTKLILDPTKGTVVSSSETIE